MPPNNDILYAIEGNIGVVTLNRPQARNALTMGMYERLGDSRAAHFAIRRRDFFYGRAISHSTFLRDVAAVEMTESITKHSYETCRPS